MKIIPFLLILFTSWCLPAPAFAEALLLDDEEEIDDPFGEEERVSEAELLKRLKLAITELDATKKRERLLDALSVLTRQKEIVVPPREMAKFRNALLDTAPAEDLRPYIPELLKIEDADLFDVGAREWLNLGIQLSVAAGGSSFGELKTLLDKRKDIIDLEWMLPALGRAGGAKAIRILKTFRRDRSIIPLGNVQNIRRVPCAAVLGCAYAGDQQAIDLIMQWYEQDYLNRPRFAWYLQWKKQTGYKITERSYALLDYCEHRIKQAERLLDFLGDERLPVLIRLANSELRIGLTDYLVRRLTHAKASELGRFTELLGHPSLLVKRQVLNTFLASGTNEQHKQMLKQVTAMRRSRHSLDRFFSVETSWMMGADNRKEILVEAIKSEENQALRRRLEGFQ